MIFMLFALVQTSKASKTDTVKIQTQTYCDHCKECESCWGKMEKELMFTKGVTKISFDEKAMVITVIYNPKKTDPSKLRLAISKAGFDADEVKADAGAQSKLDTCCKKKE